MKIPLIICALIMLLMSGCVPRIEIATPDRPLTINMNVKIEHEIKISADKNAKSLLQDSTVPKSPDLTAIR